MHGGLRRYWRRRRYEMLIGSGGRRRQNRLKLAANGDRRRRRWRIRIAPKLKLWLSPKNFLARLRDAYVNLMLRMANSPAISGGFREQVDESIVGLGKGPSKEYDEKVIVDYYNSLRRRDNWCSAMQP